jgi:Protein of unknown function
MDEDQAAEIVEYLLTAARGLDEARAAAEQLADQDKDAAAISELASKLNSELLQAMFRRFPDLLPFDEFPAISSTLRWDQVRLPPSASEAQVDQIIFSVVAPRWHKMARVIWDAVKQGQELALGVTDEMFAARIRVLIEAGRLENQGDVRKWRHSEVQLKAEPASRLN